MTFARLMFPLQTSVLEDIIALQVKTQLIPVSINGYMYFKCTVLEFGMTAETNNVAEGYIPLCRSKVKKAQRQETEHN